MILDDVLRDDVWEFGLLKQSSELSLAWSIELQFFKSLCVLPSCSFISSHDDFVVRMCLCKRC
jgi:hypothetical protein